MPILLWAWFFVFGIHAQAEETILYQENFNDGQANGWLEKSDTGATWQVKNGKYYLNIPIYRAGAESIYQNGFSWQNYTFSFDAELNDGVDRNVIFRMQDKQNYYSLGLRGFWRYAPDDTPVIYLKRCYQGQCVGDNYRNYFAAYHFADNKALNYHEISHIDIEAIGNKIKIFYNNNLVINWQEPTGNYSKSGTIGFSGWSGDYGAADVAWDNLMVKALSDATLIPILSSPGQFKSDGITPIAEAASTTENTVVFQGTPTSSAGNQAQLQVEVQPSNSAFTGIPTATSSFIASGQIASVTVSNLSSGQYHWQARVVDSQGNASTWQTMSNPAVATDFSISHEPVILIPGIMGSWNVSGRWQIDPIFHTYDNLMEALISAGYKENSLNEDKPTLFTFPYDWRTDNNITAGLLKDKINLVKEITGASKVDIIAHSMGGLVARSYIEGSDYQNDIDQVIFLGTPHQGAVKTYLSYEGAVFSGGWDWLQKYLFQIEAAFNGYPDLTGYIRAKVLTVEQLLPIYNYLKDKQPDNSWQLRPYPLNYPQNNYLENLNSQANVNLLKQRVKITNIISDLGASSTLNYLKVIADPDASDNKWQSGYPENLTENLDSLEMGNGDDTVPLSSSDSLNGVEIFKTGISDHTNLPTVMQKEIIKTLTGKQPTDYFNNKITSTIKRWAFFRVYSPVDFAVIAPDGKKIGKNFANSTEINQIPDAFYSGFTGQAEFVLIPNPLDGKYKIEVQGVANGGAYTLANSLIDGNNEISREFSGNIAPQQERDFTINYSAVSENPISDLEPVDTAPPVVTINKPTAGDKYLHSDNLVIDYTATDDFSGLATTTITIDGQEVATTTIDLFDYALGQRSLIITAFDKAGNRAQQQVNFEIIANIDSTISDIKEIYERGWLKKGIYRALLENAFKLLKIEAKFFERERELTEKLIKKTGEDSKLTAKQKQKQIEQYNKKLAELKKNRAKAIDRSLDTIVVLLNNAKKQNKINQAGYDIILNDINYLRINL